MSHSRISAAAVKMRLAVAAALNFPPMKTNPLDSIPEAVEQSRGAQLVAVLGLKPARDQHGKPFVPPRYRTGHGLKTALGLFRTVAAIVQDGE